LATVTLPAGSYLLTAKAAIVRAGGNSGSLCTLNNGATVLDQLVNQSSTSGELTVLSGSVTLAGATAITMRCYTSPGTSLSASFRVLSAYKLNTLTVQ
ncbi:MAG: hypothetical protein ABI880_09995, partial [Acidobacteriota bacterium]